jgi:hypothetical protein
MVATRAIWVSRFQSDPTVYFDGLDADDTPQKPSGNAWISQAGEKHRAGPLALMG